MSDATEWVAVAIILRPHALGGALVLKPLTRTPEEFVEAPLETVYPRLRGRVGGPLTIERLSIHKGLPLVWFSELEDRTAAEALVGQELVIPEDELWDLEEGQFYHDELAGLTVVDAVSGREYGPVLSIADGTAHDFIVIAHPDKPGAKLMIPFVQGVIVMSIDLDARRISVTLPDGLLDL
ncbi:16S rRNA processing protein RimM [bacterium]|nr:16S rRNA processing protein RimM [bacterium]